MSRSSPLSVTISWIIALGLVASALLLWHRADAPDTSSTEPPVFDSGPAGAAASPATADPPDVRAADLPPSGQTVGPPRPDRARDAISAHPPLPAAETDALPTLEHVRSMLADAIARHLPELDPSGRDLDALADATLRLRRAQQALRRIPKDPAHATQRGDMRRQLEQAIEDFRQVAEMSPAEFSRRVQPGFGIDAYDPGRAPSEISIRPLIPPETRE